MHFISTSSRSKQINSSPAIGVPWLQSMVIDVCLFLMLIPPSIITTIMRSSFNLHGGHHYLSSLPSLFAFYSWQLLGSHWCSVGVEMKCDKTTSCSLLQLGVELLQVSPGISRLFQVSPSISRYLQVSPSISRYQKISPGLMNVGI